MNGRQRMKTMKRRIVPGLLAWVLLGVGTSQAAECEERYYNPDWVSQPPTVDVYNYVRAETDIQFERYAKAGFGKLAHSREAYDVHNQVTLSGNRDTLYSMGIFDLSKSPLTITMPDTEGRYMSLQVVSQDHDVYPALYAPGTWTFTEEEIGTRYVLVNVRTFADPNDPEDMAAAHRMQDAIEVKQAGKGDLSGLPEWNEDQMLKIRKAFNALGSTLPDSSSFFGVKCDRSYLMNAMGVAVGWGGLQKQDALYLPLQVPKNDGKTAYVLRVPKDVPVEGNGFWSVTVYDANRYMVPNKYDAYSFNNVTAGKNEDGSVTIHFGGDPSADNYLPIVDGWVYLVRFYRPGREILDGTWKFPDPEEVE